MYTSKNELAVGKLKDAIANINFSQTKPSSRTGWEVSALINLQIQRNFKFPNKKKHYSTNFLRYNENTGGLKLLE